MNSSFGWQARMVVSAKKRAVGVDPSSGELALSASSEAVQTDAPRGVRVGGRGRVN